tara:strand:- start:423 stop:941 length:519 start_codon:yes stop_codon:yes gene_type:complete
MSNFKDSPKFTKHDDYYTPKWVWEQVQEFIPKDKIIWEMCLLNSNEQSKKNLIELGYEVVGDKSVDCLTETFPCDIIVTNPPFSTELKINILKKLISLDKPFMIIMNACNIFTKYFHEIMGDKEIYYIYPKGKLYYDKYNGEELISPHEKNKNCSFYSVYVCYKLIDRNYHL